MWEKSFEYLNSCLIAKEMLQNMGMWFIIYFWLLRKCGKRVLNIWIHVWLLRKCWKIWGRDLSFTFGCWENVGEEFWISWIVGLFISWDRILRTKFSYHFGVFTSVCCTNAVEGKSWEAWKLEDERNKEGREEEREERAAAPEEFLVDWRIWIGKEDTWGYCWYYTPLILSLFILYFWMGILFFLLVGIMFKKHKTVKVLSLFS